MRYYYRLKVEENGKIRYVEKICKNASNRNEAIKELERAHQDYLEGKYDTEPKLRKGKFEELCNDYLEYCRDEISYSCKKSCINQPDGLKGFFGKMDVSKITSKEVKDYKNMRKEKVNSSDNTINIHLAVLKNMFSFADEWNWELSNNVKKIVKSKFFVSVPGRTRVLSHEEEKRLYKELSSKHQLITTIALNTMMREGEIMSLKWENIDFEERKIRITLEDTITKKHKRMLYMNETVFHAFQVLKAQNGASEWVFPSSKTGTHMTEAQKTFRKAVRRAGIEDFHFHDLRRTCASRLHKAGVPLVRISRDLGHTNLKTTMIYIGLTDEEETQNYFAILDKTNGENQWNSCGTNQKAISEERVSPSNLMA